MKVRTSSTIISSLRNVKCSNITGVTNCTIYNTNLHCLRSKCDIAGEKNSSDLGTEEYTPIFGQVITDLLLNKAVKGFNSRTNVRLI